MPKRDKTVGEEWFEQENDDKLTDEQLMRDAARRAAEWQAELRRERQKCGGH